MSQRELLSETSNQAEGVPVSNRRWWPVGLGLLALVFVVLAGGVLLAQQLRPHVGIERAAASIPTVQPASTSPTAPPSVAGSQVSAPVSAAGPAAPGSGGPGSRAASSALEREVGAAYDRYLQVYSDAVLNLDSSHLSEVLDGHALQLVTDEVNDLKSKGRPVTIVEDNRVIVFGPVTDSGASLIDQYTSKSVYADPPTKQPLPRTGAPTRVRQTYQFRKVAGVWKIVDGTREELGEGSQ